MEPWGSRVHIQPNHPFARICFFSSAGNSHDGLFSLSEWHFLSTAVGSRDSLFLGFVQVTLPNKQSVFFLWLCDPTRVMASSFLRFLDHTQQRTTVGRTPLDEWSALSRDFYLTTHNTHNRQTSMPPVGFEPMISAGERPQTYALDRAASGTGVQSVYQF